MFMVSVFMIVDVLRMGLRRAHIFDMLKMCLGFIGIAVFMFVVNLLVIK